MQDTQRANSSTITAEPEASGAPALPPTQRDFNRLEPLSGTISHSYTRRNKTALMAFAVGLIGLTVLLFGIHRPPTLLFDEYYYVPAAKAIVAGSLQMDPGEPPMGKLLMAVGVKLAGDNPLGWRISGAICGSLSLVAVFLWTQLLFSDYTISMYAAGFTLVNNFLFVMSRVGMMDIFLVFFLLWALLAYTAAFELETSVAMRRILVSCSGFLFGLAGACKWNAVDTLALLFAISLALPTLAKLVRAPSSSTLHWFAANLQQVGIPSLLFALIALPGLSYMSVYWVLDRVVHLPFSLHDVLQLNYAMWRYHVLDHYHPTMFRPWYAWPFAMSPFRVLSYLMGNPVVMLGGLAGILFCLWKSWKSFEVSAGLVAFVYLGNLLQWAVTPSHASHYYYYFPAAMFLGIALAFALHRLSLTFWGIRVSLLVMMAACIVFVWCYPRMAHLDAPWDCMLGCWP